MAAACRRQNQRTEGPFANSATVQQSISKLIVSKNNDANLSELSPHAHSNVFHKKIVKCYNCQGLGHMANFGKKPKKVQQAKKCSVRSLQKMLPCTQNPVEKSSYELASKDDNFVGIAGSCFDDVNDGSSMTVDWKEISTTVDDYYLFFSFAS